MSPGTSRTLHANAVGHAPAGLLFGAQTFYARGAANVQALAFGPVGLASAPHQVYALRGPLSFMHFLRKRRTGVPAWSALAWAATVNRSFGTDTQVRRAAARPPFPCAGQLQR